jgi:hypothetical protein
LSDLDLKLAEAQDQRMDVIAEAIVTRVRKHPLREVAEGVLVRHFTIYAKMYAPVHEYSTDQFLVRIMEPAALQYLQPEKGSFMEHGEFNFDAAEHVAVDTKLKVYIVPAAHFTTLKSAPPEEIKSFAGTATATLTLAPFPIQWETKLEKFVTEPEFNAIVTELGRLAAADSNQEQEIFDALAYLINKNDFGSAVEFVANQLKNMFDRRKELLLVLYKSKEPDVARQQELDGILNEATKWHNKRSDYIHSRWAIPDKAAGGVVRLKFEKTIGRDVVEPVKPEALNKIVEGMEASTTRLRQFFWKLEDYHQWIVQRMPPI